MGMARRNACAALTWQRPGLLTGDVAGSAAPSILTWRRRAIHHGAAEKNRERPLVSMRRDGLAHRLLVEMIWL